MEMNYRLTYQLGKAFDAQATHQEEISRLESQVAVLASENNTLSNERKGLVEELFILDGQTRQLELDAENRVDDLDRDLIHAGLYTASLREDNN